MRKTATYKPIVVNIIPWQDVMLSGYIKIANGECKIYMHSYIVNCIVGTAYCTEHKQSKDCGSQA